MEKEPMTPWGFQKISSELENLKNVQRGVIAKEIQEARELGDLKENAEYHAAKEKQAHMETRIALLEDYISRSHVIDPKTLSHKKVSFGSWVKLLDLETEAEKEYVIVGAVESNVEKGFISFNSPIAKMLMGKSIGDDFVADLPNGVAEYEILDIKYKEITFD